MEHKKIKIYRIRGTALLSAVLAVGGIAYWIYRRVRLKKGGVSENEVEQD